MTRLAAAAFAIAGALFLIPASARAHFILQAPANWANQDGSGNPQKSAPCGQADGAPATPSGVVTAFAPGETITVTISETVPHPGHYRVALSSTGQAGLPADPAVTPVGTDACGSTVVQNPPVFPVIADGMLEHTSAFSGPQSFTVTLPSNVSCPGGAGDGSICTLQVIEYMSNHGAPCFYHHCADITIGASGGGDAGSVPPHDEACGCAVRGSPASAAGALLIAALVLARRRRGRR